jgi:hypothetical protein
MKSNKKCVFNVTFQYNHKQVPTSYFSMMFNIHKHISHLIFVLVPECGEYWNLQSKNNFKVDFSSAAIFYWPFSSVIDRNRNRSFNLIQNKVGNRSCFATGVKLGTIFMKQFWRYLILNRKKPAKFWRWPAELIVHLVRRVFFPNPQWNFTCYYTKVSFNIIRTIHKKYRKQNKQPPQKVRLLIHHALDM